MDSQRETLGISEVLKSIYETEIHVMDTKSLLWISDAISVELRERDLAKKKQQESDSIPDGSGC